MNRKRYIGFNHGQIGDLAINMIALKSLKLKEPDCHFTMGIAKKYASAAPLFFNHPLIDDIHIWEGYDEWPALSDIKYIEEQKFDYVFNPKAPVLDNLWFLKEHHTQQVCRMHGLDVIDDLQIELNQYFGLSYKYANHVAISPYSSAGAVRDIPEEASIQIIKYLHSIGIKTIQLGIKSHKQLPTTDLIPGGSIFDDIQIALGCRALVTADTGFNYLLSGYQHNVLGLYSTGFYPLHAPLKNRAPVNPNAIYLEGKSILDIPINTVYNCLKHVCRIR